MNQTPPPPVSNQPRNCGLAVWSLVLGILSLACFSVICGIPAVICGHRGLSRIRQSAGALKGQGLAIGGLVTGYTSIALIPIIGLLAAIAVPNFVRARQTAQMNACINNLRMIDGAVQQWALEGSKRAEDTPTEEDIKTYLPGNQMPRCLAGGVYTIGTVAQRPTCSIPTHRLPP